MQLCRHYGKISYGESSEFAMHAKQNSNISPRLQESYFLPRYCLQTKGLRLSVNKLRETGERPHTTGLRAGPGRDLSSSQHFAKKQTTVLHSTLVAHNRTYSWT